MAAAKHYRYNGVMSKELSAKSKIALDFLDLADKGEVKKAFDQYATSSFKHHNPRFKGDRNSMIVAMEKTAKDFPKLVAERIKVLEDGNFVAVHSSIKPLPENRRTDLTYIHIFRFSKGKIAELWDFGQPIPANIVNENGMF